ncbi:MAG: DEAD/DEAH box helicase [Turicibacter sp.]|nr:DEAD/DEAH box helicase [Turicibacter sp.]
MFSKGSIITGPQWDEPVEVISFEEEEGIGYLVRASGRKSQRFYEDYVMYDDLGRIQNNTEARKGNDTDDSIGKILRYHFLKQDMRFSQQQARGNGNVMPLPHQIEAVYSRMLAHSNVRYLLADDPGAGKTIMSGMLLSELGSRGIADRILIMVPPLVLKQWQEELKSKFGEDFIILDRQMLNASSGNPFAEHPKILCSLYWAMRDEVKTELLATSFDLAIIDEAHKLAAYTEKKGKTRRTKLYRLGEAVAQKTQHLVLLTATPHKGDRENYRHLMRLIDEDLFNESVSNRKMQETAQPYVIRRLKESMVQFDGSPLFPKRTTSTLKFDLSNAELELYEAVTTYVREHFNRAKRDGNRSTSFAMMLLQRRLSSSLEAIYISLVRRREKLLLSLECLEFSLPDFPGFGDEDEISMEELENMEADFLGAAELDPIELQIEIEELDRLIGLAEIIRSHNIEYKFEALERTLFGKNGLIANGEKLLIFTESKDTLRYLKRRLEDSLGEVVCIEGSMNMAQRQLAVSRFKKDISVMLATDAGGESINLQFCNQMVNYDIPWNPNRLEQRMGRIHRIGQKNEVFIFNLVAGNTREGIVMERLLGKLEAMRLDLGQDLVYDFLGEVLEEENLSLDGLMVEAIQNREKLDDVIEKMDKALSEEHAQLIELAKREKTADTVDLPGIRRTFNHTNMNALPNRAYGDFLRFELEKQRITVTERIKNIFRVQHIPKNIQKKAHEMGAKLGKDDGFVLTTDRKRVTEDISLATATHPIVNLLMNLADEELLATKLKSYHTNLSSPLDLVVVAISYRLRDGNGNIIENCLRIFAEQPTGEVSEISPRWLFSKSESDFKESGIGYQNLLLAAKRQIVKEQHDARTKRQLRGLQKQEQLENAFCERLKILKERLVKYQEEDTNHKNSALINKTVSEIREQQARKEVRLAQAERESTISLQKIDALIALSTKGDANSWRLIPGDTQLIVELYEEQKGRKITQLPAFGLVDFISEDSEGNIRYIIATSKNPENIDYLEDYDEIMDATYLYQLDGYVVNTEMPLGLFT